MNGSLFSPQGELLFYVHDGFLSTYERELEFIFENGILMDTQVLDNSKTKKSKYTEDKNLLKEFIANNINYDHLPKSDTMTKRVMLFVRSANDDGKIDSVTVIRGVNELYDKEAIRVVKSIPEWEVIYLHGKRVGRSWSIPVVFSNVE